MSVCVFKSRSNKHLSFLQLKTDIIKVKTLEEDLSNGDNNKAKSTVKSGKRSAIFLFSRNRLHSEKGKRIVFVLFYLFNILFNI